MLHLILLTLSIAILAWILPWRALRLWRAAIIMAVAVSIPFVVYDYSGYSDGLATKQALHVFDDAPNEDNLEKIHSHLAKHIDKHPDDGLAYVILGRLHFAEQKYDRSADAFAEAYKQYEHDEDLWIEYAAALYLSQTDNDTLNELMQKITFAPKEN